MRATSIFIFLALPLTVPAQQAEGLQTGSGFFFTADGYLLTNLHVVQGCQTSSLRTEGAWASAKILFSDAKNDSALLRSEHPTAFLVFRDDQRLKLGEGVLAAGYPLAGVVASSMNLTTGTVNTGGRGVLRARVQSVGTAC